MNAPDGSTRCPPEPTSTKSPHQSPDVVRRRDHIEFYLRSMPLNEGGSYEIRLQGHLDDHWVDWLEGLALTRENDGTTTLTGQLADQAALHGVLNNIRDLNLPIVSVRRVDSEAERLIR
jgi:hypothetical protein